MVEFVVFKSIANKQWFWHLLGGNGEIMAQSEGYTTRWGAKRGAKRFATVAGTAPIVVEK